MDQDSLYRFHGIIQAETADALQSCDPSGATNRYFSASQSKHSRRFGSAEDYQPGPWLLLDLSAPGNANAAHFITVGQHCR